MKRYGKNGLPRGREMGSRVMHYCITALLNKSLNFTSDAFFLGGLAPDLHSYMGESKYYLTHFALKDDQGNTITDYDRYRRKYLVNAPSPFYLGYFFHLIFDEIWKKEIYYKKIKGLRTEDRKVALEKNYRDFWRLNGKIINYHSLQLRKLEPMAIQMDEIDCRYFPALINELYRDFELKDKASGEALELLDFDEVVNVMDISVQACLEAYSAVRKTSYNKDPEEELHGTD